MAVFISHSHEDAEFVDQLAAHLIAGNAEVWVDRWELHVGDSLRRRIEGAMDQATAIVFVLSPAAIESEWCQRELSAGLVRELEEKRVVVLPVLAEDCEIPLFLRDKMYADFRTDFDRGLRQVRESLARAVSQSLGRTEMAADDHIDWATQWGLEPEDGEVVIVITMVQQSANSPYTVLSGVRVRLNDTASRRHIELVDAGGEGVARQLVLEVLADSPALDDFRVLIEDAEPTSREIGIRDEGADLTFLIDATCQRLGEDTGRDIVMPIGRVLRRLAGQTRDRMRPPEREQREAILQIMRRYRPGLDPRREPA